MPKITVEAPAKVNLHLRVKARRPDGFHDLESIFVSLAFGDALHFELLSEDKALEILMEGDSAALAAVPAALPTEKNIIFKAVSLFRIRTGFDQGLRVRVEKRIPLGGGLGGASSNAASTLLALNSLYVAASGSPLSTDSLAEMAASLGSDVPFFLTKSGAAWVTGRGEKIRPLEAPKNLFFVLVNPGFPSETAAAFRLLDEIRGALPGNRLNDADNPEAALINALAGPPRTWPFENDFLPVFLRDSARGDANARSYRKIIGQLRDLGADFAGLSGAGSTCFGVFAEREQAAEAEKSLSKTWKLVKYSFLLARRAIAVLE
jgi:4-diphosphocytidyl-2-C-methyl-D-erythritol kinase